MHLFNSTKTRPVSKKMKSPMTYQLVKKEDGSLVRVPFDCTPIVGDASAFSLDNQLKTGVKFDAPQGAFINPRPLEQSDLAAEYAEKYVDLSPDVPTPDVPTPDVPAPDVQNV